MKIHSVEKFMSISEPIFHLFAQPHPLILCGNTPCNCVDILSPFSRNANNTYRLNIPDTSGLKILKSIRRTVHHQHISQPTSTGWNLFQKRLQTYTHTKKKNEVGNRNCRLMFNEHEFCSALICITCVPLLMFASLSLSLPK